MTHQQLMDHHQEVHITVIEGKQVQEHAEVSIAYAISVLEEVKQHMVYGAAEAGVIDRYMQREKALLK